LTGQPVAAVVVRWKGGDEVHRCVASLGGAREVVVVDNGSADGGAERLASAFPTVRVDALSDNLGFAGGVNRGVEGTSEPLVLLLNPDAALVKGALALLVAHLQQDPALAGVAPALIDDRGRWDHAWQCRRLPQWFDLGMGRSGRPAFARPPEVPAAVSQPAAAAWLVRRDVLEGLGGLDRAFHPAWWEDVDFCARLAVRDQGGNRWDVVPAARALHHGGTSVPHLGSTAFAEIYHRNLVRYVLRHHCGQAPRIRRLLWWSLWIRGRRWPARRVACRSAWRAARETFDGSAASTMTAPT
jgi:GT2 family glycosyltransferase